MTRKTAGASTCHCCDGTRTVQGLDGAPRPCSRCSPQAFNRWSDARRPAITLWQPWATLVAAGAKPFEFRSWAAPRRLWGVRVAIHAGARAPRRAEMQELMLRLAKEDFATTGLHREIAMNVLEATWRNLPLLPLSSVVCLATLGEPIRGAELAAKLGTPQTNDSDRDEHTNWGWPLTDILPLEPIVPARGAQGWWTWTKSDA